MTENNSPIFELMKFFSAFLLLLMTFFLVQPIFAHSHIEEMKNCCSKKRNATNKDCGDNCNPFFTCCYCQYISPKAISINESVHPVIIILSSVENYPVIKGFPFSCWHPPKVC